MTSEMKINLLGEIEKLHQRHELSKKVDASYYEPGMMEYLDKSEGQYDESSGEIIIRFEARGTRYDGRTEQIEKVSLGDVICVIRDKENPFNSNNFTFVTSKGHNVGNMPAELCNVIAPIYDAGEITFVHASVSYVEPISKRSRYAKQAVLFVELRAMLNLV